jgi:DNA-binding GntR family transcriptional regulator
MKEPNMSTPSGPGTRTPSATEGSVAAVTRQLRTWIVNGSLLPGVQLRQDEIAEQLNVSRLPVREALQILTERQLLEHRRHRGYFVANRAKDEIDQLNRMLNLLEPELIQSARWLEPDELDYLKSLNAQLEDLVDSDDVASFIDLNRLFHFTIFSYSPMKIILGEVERLWTLIDANTARSLASPAEKRRTVKEHSTMISAIERRSRTALLRISETHRTETYISGRNPGPTVSPGTVAYRTPGKKQS